MKILDRARLEDFCTRHADARHWIENWIADVEAPWRTLREIRDRYASVSFLGAGRVIFNVKGNAYRLEATVAYRTRTVAIEWLGTHAEYDERNRRR